MAENRGFYNLLYVKDEAKLVSKLDKLRKDGFNLAYCIHIASALGNLPVVNYLLSHQHTSTNILCFDSNGDTALHAAAQGGNIKVFDALVDALASNDSSDFRIRNCVPFTLDTPGPGREYYINNTRNDIAGALPIHHAVGRSHIDMARHLLDNGADINSTDSSGATPFHFAARCGSIAALEFVFERQSGDVNHSSRAGLTALHYAAWNGKHEAIEWLLKQGAQIKIYDKVEGATPLHWAAMRGNKEALEMLARAKPRGVLWKNKRHQNVLEVAEDYEVLVKDLLDMLFKLRNGTKDPGVFPQVRLAKHVVGYGHGPMILELRADLARHWNRGILQELVQDADGSGIVEWAARTGNKESIDLVMELLCKYTEPEVLNKKLYAGLHRALLNGKIDFVKTLADHKDCKGKISMVHVLKGLRKFLVDKDLIASIPAKDLKLVNNLDDVSLVIRKEIPLAFWLFHRNREDIVTFISDQRLWGALVNEQGPNTRRTALHWATILKKHDIVKRLCEIKECKTNPNDFIGNYPHAYAVTQEIQMELTAHEDVQADLYRDRQLFVDALNAILVGAALIAAISFQGFLQPPRGYDKMYMYVEGQSIKSFIRFNSMSFFFAMASALTAARGVLPMQDIYIHDALKRVARALFASATYLSLSIGSTLVAFGAAGHSVIPQKHERTGFNTVLGVGGAVTLLMLLWFLKGLLGLLIKYFLNHYVTMSAAVDEMSELDEDSKVQLKRTVYGVGRNHSEVPWDDGLDKLLLDLPAAKASPHPGPEPDAGRPSPAAPISIDLLD